MPYQTPGVYVEEISIKPRSISETPSAVPGFVGYTEKALWQDRDLTLKPTRIASLFDFETRFGGAPRPGLLSVALDSQNRVLRVNRQERYLLYAALQLYFANGGGACYITSVGPFTTARNRQTIALNSLEHGIEQQTREPAITLTACPDAALMRAEHLAVLHRQMLSQSAKLKRFSLLDLRESGNLSASVRDFRQHLGTSHLRYGAAYTPHLRSRFSGGFGFADINLQRNGVTVSLAAITAQAGLDHLPVKQLMSALKQGDQKKAALLERELERSNPIYAGVVRAIRERGVLVPPSAAVAGIYARVDAQRGVWKAPANVSLFEVREPAHPIDNPTQQTLTYDASEGKSINPIRYFDQRGILVWGARTLAGNDNEWRYVPAQRLHNLLFHSIGQGTQWAVFEPNDANLWQQLRQQIEGYLYGLWQRGALQGSTPDQAFFAKVGLGQTMTVEDINNGRVLIEVGIALVRPAEFSLLTIEHRQQGE